MHVYIQGNVLGDNRHAIAGTGRTGDEYVAIGNLFLNPGLNKDRDGLEVIYNHQIDMHGAGPAATKGMTAARAACTNKSSPARAGERGDPRRRGAPPKMGGTPRRPSQWVQFGGLEQLPVPISLDATSFNTGCP